MQKLSTKKNNVSVSIIIVHYKARDELFDLLSSIKNSKSHTNYEAIIVDNDEKKSIGIDFLRHFNWVKYVSSEGNIGFGAGNNLGVKHAKGKFLFFLNPDTKVFQNTINNLVNFLLKNKKFGVISPILLDVNLAPYPLQGTLELTPTRAIFALSFINKIFPNNPISRKFWLSTWNRKKTIETDVVPGTAMMIRKDIFEKIGGFDDRFFLFFEENDVCRRVKNSGFKVGILPNAKIVHFWGRSTKKRKDTEKIFSKSRFLYFKKHFGILKALLVESFLRINTTIIFLLAIMGISLFLRVFKLNELMMFIGDQGLFYLPARDMILYGTIPLVGPETSHPWIHHGALWTYVLAIILWLFQFNPLAPAYFIAILGVITIFLFYVTLNSMFDRRTAILGSILYATSPLIVMNARMPYHTSPIPFFVIILFFLSFKLVKGNSWVLPVVTFMLGTLYNHEITTFVYFIAVGIILGFGFTQHLKKGAGFIKKELWFKKLLDKRLVLISIVSFLVPMIPFILYDIFYGGKQTIWFLIWVFWRVIKFPISLIDRSFASPGSNPSTLLEFFSYYNQLIFASSSMIPLIILFMTIIFVIWYLIRNIRFQKRIFDQKISSSYILLFIFLSVGLIGLSIHRVPIEADTLLIAPFILILTSISILWIVKNNFVLALICVIVVSTFNIQFLLSTDFMTKDSFRRIAFYERMKAVEQIIAIASGNPYNIVGEGELSEFRSFTLGYEYLLWWKGHPPETRNVPLKIVILEKGNKVSVFKK